MTEVGITCLCGRSSTTVQLCDALPISSSICHRSQCRYNLGALCHSALPIKDRPDDSIIDRLSKFEPQQGLFRYFCSHCGTHLFENDTGWRVQSGVIERIHSEQVFDALERIVDHTSIHETIDGGLSSSLTGSQDYSKPDLPQNTTACSQIEANESAPSAISNPSSDQERSHLPASCVCGGVQFYLTRPDASSAAVSSPWPDLIVPYCDRDPANPGDVKWWIRDGGRWLAGTCACRSCRLGLGSPIQAWTFVSKSNLFRPNGSALTFDLGTLQSFESSPGATREFCRRCGATVFWHNTERPGVVDVSVGLLRAPDGVLARSWLKWWTERVSFAEEALDKQLINLLQSNLVNLQLDVPRERAQRR